MYVEVSDEEARVIRGVLEHNGDAIVDGWNMGWGELASLMAKFEEVPEQAPRINCHDCGESTPSGPAYFASNRCPSCYDLWMAAVDEMEVEDDG